MAGTLRGILYLLLVPLVGGLLARWIDPQDFWWFAPFGDSYNIVSLIALPPALILCLLPSTRPLALLVLFVLLATHVQQRYWHSMPGASDATDASGATIKLLTFNMPRNQESPATIARATRLFATQNADLVLLQETQLAALVETPEIVQGPPKIRYLLHQGGYRGSTPVRLAPGGRWYALQQPVLAREKPVYFREIIDLDLPVGSASLYRLTIDDKTVTVVNLHLASFGASKPWSDTGFNWLSFDAWNRYLKQWKTAYTKRSRQAAALAQIIAGINGPLIVGGDLNSTDRSWAYHKIRGPLQDVYRMTGTGWGGTFHANLPILRIDHVFVSHHFSPVSAEVVATDHEISDHRPLAVRVRWSTR